MVQLGVSYAHVTRILNCTKLTRLIQCNRVTCRTAYRPLCLRPHVTTANEDCHLCILHLHNIFFTVTSSAATGLGYVNRCHTTTTWYQYPSTIQWDDIDEETSTSTFMLVMSVSMLGTLELAMCTCF